MRSNRPELVKQMTDVVNEIIPAIPVDDRTSGLVARIGECILKGAAEEQATRVYWRPRQPKWARSRKREQVRLLPNRRSGRGRYKSVTTIPRSPHSLASE
jgi:hypothetical protein